MDEPTGLGQVSAPDLLRSRAAHEGLMRAPLQTASPHAISEPGFEGLLISAGLSIPTYGATVIATPSGGCGELMLPENHAAMYNAYMAAGAVEVPDEPVDFQCDVDVDELVDELVGDMAGM